MIRTFAFGDAHSGECILSFQVKSLGAEISTAVSVTSIEFILSGERLLSCSEDRTVRLWDATNGKQINLYAHPCFVRVLSVTRRGRQFVFGDINSEIYVTSVELDGPPTLIHRHDAEIREIRLLTYTVVVVDANGRHVLNLKQRPSPLIKHVSSPGGGIKCCSTRLDGNIMATGAN